MNEAQKQKVKELGNEIFGLMKDGVKDLWKKEDEEFLKQIAQDVANQKMLAEMSNTPEVHIKNIQHLVATLEGEVVRKGLKIRAFQREMFVKILTVIIKTVAVPLLKAAIQKD